jgi:hypothetical protein
MVIFVSPVAHGSAGAKLEWARRIYSELTPLPAANGVESLNSR